MRRLRRSRAGKILTATRVVKVMMGLLDMPLISVMMWQQAAFAEHPEDIVSGLLKQVHAM